MAAENVKLKTQQCQSLLVPVYMLKKLQSPLAEMNFRLCLLSGFK